MKAKQETKTKQETKQEQAEKPELELTEQQIADFTRLAELQKTGSENTKSRKLITDAYRAFAKDNQDALNPDKGGVRSGKLKVWVEVKRELHAAIID